MCTNRQTRNQYTKLLVRLCRWYANIVDTPERMVNVYPEEMCAGASGIGLLGSRPEFGRWRVCPTLRVSHAQVSYPKGVACPECSTLRGKPKHNTTMLLSSSLLCSQCFAHSDSATEGTRCISVFSIPWEINVLPRGGVPRAERNEPSLPRGDRERNCIRWAPLLWPCVEKQD